MSQVRILSFRPVGSADSQTSLFVLPFFFILFPMAYFVMNIRTISSVHNTSELRTLDFLPMLMSNKAKGNVDFISDL